MQLLMPPFPVRFVLHGSDDAFFCVNSYAYQIFIDFETQSVTVKPYDQT